jgi:hypothetical protein
VTDRDANDIARLDGVDVLRDVLDNAAPLDPTGSVPGRIVLTLPEFLATRKPPDYLVDGLFKGAFLYAVTAMTGAGKTAVALLLSVVVADPKRRWKFGPHEARHGRVVYVTCENPEDVKERLIGMSDRMGFDPEEFAKTFLVIDRVNDLGKEMERIRRDVAAFGKVDLVVLDTSAALFVGKDENDSIQMLNHARAQRALCELPGSPCVIALNHPIKHATSPEHLLPRGGGGYLNEIDGNFTLWAHDERLTDLYWTGKLRGQHFEKITFRLVTINTPKLVDSRGRAMPTVMAEAGTSEDIAESEAKARFQENQRLKAMAAKPGASLSELALACEWFLSDSTPYKSLVQRVMGRLLRDKLVKKSGRDYELTSAGRAAAAKM